MVEVDLCYQSVMPRFIEHLSQFETVEVESFDNMYREQDNVPVIIESVRVEVPNTVEKDFIEINPAGFALHPSYPNPFNSSTEISFSLSTPTKVELLIVDLSGREVKSLHFGQTQAGTYHFGWDGANSNGIKATSGLYFIRLITSRGSDLKKVVFLG